MTTAQQPIRVPRSLGAQGPSTRRLVEGGASARDHMPLWTILIWWAVCYALYVSGWPIQYARTNAWQTTIFFSACALATSGGFILGVRTPLTRLARQSRSEIVARIGLVAPIVLFIPTLRSYSGIQAGQLGLAFQNQSAAYQQSADVIAQGSDARSMILVLLTLSAPFTLVAVPYYVREFFQGRKRVALVAVAVLPPLSLSILTGRTQQLGMTTLVGGAAWMLARRTTGRRLGPRAMLASLLVVLGLFAIVAYRKTERLDGRFICRPGQINCTTETTGLLDAFTTVASYASQGFEGLSRSFESEWAFGGGYSHSPALRNLVESFLGGGSGRVVVTDHLPVHGWSDKVYWSTALPQIANDVHWVLIVPLLGFVAWLFGRVWRRAVLEGDWLTTTLACYLWVAFAFIPQNYQLGASGPTYVGFLVLCALLVIRAVHRRGGP